MRTTSYAIALGSNRRHGRHGSPAATLRAAVFAMEEQGLQVEAVSRIRTTPALGPAGRSFSNAVAIISCDLDPLDLLDQLKAIEDWFGRRPGQRWGARVLDLDIILWSAGAFGSEGLIVPHTSFRERLFVLDPLMEIAPDWRDPISGLSVRQIRSRLIARRPVDQDRTRP